MQKKAVAFTGHRPESLPFGRDMHSGKYDDFELIVDLKAEVRQLIAALENPEQQLILELRYLCFKQWSAIMEEMGISETSVYRIHGEALKNIVVPEKWE